MGIDKETVPTSLSVWIDKDVKLLKTLADKGYEFNGKEKPEQWVIVDDMGSLSPSEYYFDDGIGNIVYSGNLIVDGKNISFNIYLPLSDTVLIDILQHSIKKLNKLKLAMETLK